MIGVPAFNPCAVVVVTVTTVPGVVPLPDIILVIPIGSVPNAPTISYSGRCGANPPGTAGYF